MPAALKCGLVDSGQEQDVSGDRRLDERLSDDPAQVRSPAALPGQVRHRDDGDSFVSG